MAKSENEKARQRAIAVAQAKRLRAEQESAQQSAWNPANSLAPLELGVSMASKAVAEPAAGLAGAGKLITSGGDVDQAVETISSVRDKMTYQPRLQPTQKAEAAIGKGMDKALGWYFDWTDEQAEKVALGGQPALAAAFKGIMDTAPFFATRGGRVSQFFRDRPGYNPAKIAQDMGYVLPPTTISNGVPVGGPFKRFAQTAGGKSRTTAKINLKNQKITNDFARKEIGLKPGEPFSGAAFSRVAKPWKAAQERIKALNIPITIDGKYAQQIQKVFDELQNHFTGKPLPKSVQKEFQFLASPQGQMTPKALLDQVYKLRDEAKRGFRQKSMKAQQKAYAQWNAATALEDLLERQLSKSASTGARGSRSNRRLVEDFRKARRELAKIRTVQDALDGSDVNLARLLAHRNRGGYLSGNLEVMADMAEQFPRALRTSSTLGEMAGLGELDLLLSGAGVSSMLGGAGVTGGWMAGWAPMRGVASSIAAAKPKNYGSLQEWLLRGELLSSQGYGKEE